MTFEYLAENLENKSIENLSKSDIVSKIVSDYTNYENNRAINLTQSHSLIDEKLSTILLQLFHSS